MINGNGLEARLIGPLTKIFPDTDPPAGDYPSATALRNETVNLQLILRQTRDRPTKAKVSVYFPSHSGFLLRKVSLVPVGFPNYAGARGAMLRSVPGLYPDPLEELSGGEVILPPGQWRAVWVTLNPGGLDMKPGSFTVNITTEEDDAPPLTLSFTLDILDARLPPQRLKRTEWFHYDGIAQYYNVPVFSEEFWRITANFIRTAADGGINMMLVPLFTPPIDTEKNGERLTVQLIDVERRGGSYLFGFFRLKRFIDMCIDAGIEYFEMSHLFTQWGARHAPKVMVRQNGVESASFGWQADAQGREYRAFLKEFIPALLIFLEKENLSDRVYLHVSDEPGANDMESYGSAIAFLRELAPNIPILDALSDFEYVNGGICDIPVPATDSIEPFLAKRPKELWTYYCCAQSSDVSNRFICMPTARTRIIGMQLYRYNADGFLHWGYNFYNTAGSVRPTDPWRDAEAELSLPAGDTFLVYPGPDGRPAVSIRYEAMREAMQDLRALNLLEGLAGREKTVELLESALGGPLTFTRYPSDEGSIYRAREAVNRAIIEHGANKLDA